MYSTQQQATTASPCSPNRGASALWIAMTTRRLPPRASSHGGGAKAKKMVKQPKGSGQEKRLKRGEFVTREVRGTHLTYTVLSGRKMYVPVAGSSLQSIIKIIAQSDSPDGVEPSPDFSALLQKIDRPRIGWRAHRHDAKYHGNWYMRWQAPDGTTHTQAGGFQVPRRALSGEIYAFKEAFEAAKQVLHRVKKTWNEKDQSLLPRFDA